MESKIQKTTQHLQLKSSLELTDREARIGEIISDVNNLISFPIPIDSLAAWSKQIARLRPVIKVVNNYEMSAIGLTHDCLEFLMDQFAIDAIEWDNKKGIQNIFNGLRRVYFDHADQEFKLAP